MTTGIKPRDFPRVAELGVIAENAETRGKKRGNAEWQNPRVFRAFSAFSAITEKAAEKGTECENMQCYNTKYTPKRGI